MAMIDCLLKATAHPTMVKLRFFAIFLCLCFLFPGMVACKAENPENTIKAFLDAAKEYDHETLLRFVFTDDTDVFFWGLNEKQFLVYSDSLAHSSSFRLFYRFCAKKLSYQIKESHVDGDHATVVVSCQYVNGQDAIYELYNDTLYTMTLKQLNGTLDPNTDYYDATIVERISADNENFLTATVTISCEYTDHGWKVLWNDILTEVITSCLFLNEISEAP
jgi:hypothetical protein